MIEVLNVILCAFHMFNFNKNFFFRALLFKKENRSHPAMVKFKTSCSRKLLIIIHLSWVKWVNLSEVNISIRGAKNDSQHFRIDR